MTPNAKVLYRVTLGCGRMFDFNRAELTAGLRHCGYHRADIKRFWSDVDLNASSLDKDCPASVDRATELLADLCESMKRGRIYFDQAERNRVRVLGEPIRNRREKPVSGSTVTAQEAFEF